MLFTENLKLNMPEDGDQYDQELYNQNFRTIDKKAGTVDGKLSENFAAIGEVNAKIPAQANPENQLADKNFVNSSIATNTANFIGDFDSLEALESQSEIPVTNNDYAFVKTVDSAGNNIYNRYKYNAQEDKWLFEYALNNTGFTAEQMAAINSGATKELIDKLRQMSAESLIPVATIITSVAETAPDGYLLCDGGIYAQTQYPALYAAIGDKYNGSGVTAGFFRVPDLRELVLVGSGQNTQETIANHDVFEVGEFKDDQLQNHQHKVANYGARTGSGVWMWSASTEQGLANDIVVGNQFTGRSGATTRTKQFGVNYFIKAV